MFKQLWEDELGAVVTLEIVLIATMLCIGLITGLTTVRDAVITELADIAAAVACMDQSVSVLGATSPSAATGSMNFVDNVDVGDTQAAAVNSQCLVICNGVPVEPLPGNENQQ